MNRKLNYLQLLLNIIVLTQSFPRCNSQRSGNQQYETCRRSSYRCGEFNLGYPFWGGNDRPASCGYPGFELSCENDNTPLINISSTSYRVLTVNESAETLTVAREDLWDTICTSDPVQTPLNFAIFSYYSASNDQNITLYYGCAQDPIFGQIVPSQNRFSCSSNNFNFYFPGDFSSLGARNGAISSNCSSSFSVTVNQSQFQMIERNTLSGTATTQLLQDSLRSGFTIQWSANNENCNNCMVSGGVCGSDPGSGSFACHCIDGMHDSTCDGTGNNGRKANSGRNIGLSIGGAVLACVGLGWLIFYYRTKRKQKLAVIQSSKYIINKDSIETPASSTSKGISSTPPSSSDFMTTTTQSSNSNPSKSASFYGVQVFTYTELEEATNNFDPAKELGDGGFGTVYHGVLRDGRVVAVKLLYENNYRRVEQFMNEVRILTTLRHDNLVQLYGCTSRRSRELLLVYEYIPNGTVSDHLHGKRAKSGLLSWPIRLNIAVETAQALSYLHKKGIIHRDVKTNNILLDSDFRVKVADFGLSRLFPKDITHVSTAPQGTPGYVDPEYYQCYQLTEKSDVYSFGVVLIELLSSLLAVDTSRDRYDINLANMAVNKIQNRALQEIVDPSLGFERDGGVRRMITSVSELAFRCLQQERDSRPSMDEVLLGLRGIQRGDGDGDLRVEINVHVDDDDRDHAVLLKGGVESPPPDSSG